MEKAAPAFSPALFDPACPDILLQLMPGMVVTQLDQGIGQLVCVCRVDGAMLQHPPATMGEQATQEEWAPQTWAMTVAQTTATRTPGALYQRRRSLSLTLKFASCQQVLQGLQVAIGGYTEEQLLSTFAAVPVHIIRTTQLWFSG